MDVPNARGYMRQRHYLQSFLNNQPLLNAYRIQEQGNQAVLDYLPKRLRLVTDPARRREIILRVLVNRPTLLSDFLRQRKLERDRQQPKEWYDNITIAERTHLIEILDQPIYLAPSHIPISERDILRQKISSRVEEDEVFETARSRTEYYHRLAEKLREAEMELEEKWAAPPQLNAWGQRVDGNRGVLGPPAAPFI